MPRVTWPWMPAPRWLEEEKDNETTMFNEIDDHQEIRDAVRALCRQFPDEYLRKVDEQKAYPEKFVDALMEAGWLAAMIPEEYGGHGLGPPPDTGVMREINQDGGQPGAGHGPMCGKGTTNRHSDNNEK